MEDDLNFFKNGRRPKYYLKREDNIFISFKLETTSIFPRIDNDLLFFGKWKTTSFFFRLENDLNLFENGRRPQFF